MTDYTISSIDNHTWRIDEGGVRFFLLEGREKALLIDSGMQVTNAKDIAKTLTKNPIELINTHGDRDHIGSNAQFERFYMSLSEAANYYSKGGKGTIIPVSEGDIYDLGNRKLEIIGLSGHTPGSIGILDLNSRRLFSGDPIQKNGQIYMFGPMRDMHAYIASLTRLSRRISEISEIYPSHSIAPIEPEAISECLKCAKRFVEDSPHGDKIKLFDNLHVIRYDMGYTSFLGACEEQ